MPCGKSGAVACVAGSDCKEDISILQLQRWLEKFGLCCGTRAKGFQIGCKMNILDGRHFSSLREVGEVSLQEKATPEKDQI